ncbi:hypothetical protein [Acinetobacter baumannii]|uniref:hypothetical protein n=1 Tax=Acinetobacter baumannii TaxID=470 RepID=UPI003B00FF9C
MTSAVPVPTTVPTTFLTVALASQVRLDGAVVSGAIIVFGVVVLPALSAAISFHHLDNFIRNCNLYFTCSTSNTVAASVKLDRWSDLKVL